MVQEVADVAAFLIRKHKEWKRAIGAKELSSLLRVDMKINFKAGKERTDGMVDSAITIDRTMLSNPAIRVVVLRLDSKYPGMFTVWKLQDVISANSSSQKKICWFLQCVEDALVTEKKESGEITSKSQICTSHPPHY